MSYSFCSDKARSENFEPILRIAYLSKSTIPSMEANSVHVMRMGSAFCRQGASVVLAHAGNPQVEISMEDSQITEFYGADERLKRVRLEPKVPICRARFHAYRAARVALAHEAELAYCRDVFSCLFALRRGIPSVIELHALPPIDSQTGKALRKIFPQDALRAIVVITESLKTEVSKLYGIDGNKIIVCPDAADDLSQCVPKRLDSDGRLRVGYLGSLQPGKGMEIIAKLPAHCPDVDFHVVGGSNEQIASWQSKLVDQKNIFFHGHVPPAEAGEYLAAFDIALAPNQEKVIVRGGTDIGRFTSPMKLFEYMSAGKPIIASDLPVLREVLHHDQNAWLCEPTSPEKWRDSIFKLAKDPAVALRLASNARKDFEQYWSWDARAKRLLSIVMDA